MHPVWKKKYVENTVKKHSLDRTTKPELDYDAWIKIEHFVHKVGKQS